MDLIPTSQTDLDFVADAALYAADHLSIEQLTAKHGGDIDMVLARLADPETARDIDARAVENAQNGSEAKAAAHTLLRRALSHLDGALDNDELGAATVVRIADLAHRVTGLAQPVRDITTDDRSRFSVNIIFSNPDKAASAQIVDVVAQEVGK